MQTPTLALLVIKCANIEAARSFYEKLGLVFQQEQHGKGPIHYSSLLGDVIFEIYPLNQFDTADKTRLGFRVDDLETVMAKLIANDYRVISSPKLTEYGILALAKDTDGRTVEIYQK